MKSAGVAPGRARIGTSGWVYPHWVGGFYPTAVRASARLSYYASRFDTVEINSTFYRLPSETSVAAWAEQAPPDFVFAWKASRFITQAKKLKDAGQPLELVFRRMLPLGDALGPALFQLPPQLRLNIDRLADFLALLPKTRRATIEFRHPGWYSPAVFQLLADFDVALCISDHHDAPSPWVATARHVYVRGHGPGGRYRGHYRSETLTRWKRRLLAMRRSGRTAYVYFDNDQKSAAPKDAAQLQAIFEKIKKVRQDGLKHRD